MLATKVSSIKSKIDNALEDFDSQLPYLKTMRNVDQHFDDYAMDQGRNKNISRKSLEVGMFSDQIWHWLGFKVDIEKALKTSEGFFQVIRESQTSVETVASDGS